MCGQYVVHDRTRPGLTPPSIRDDLVFDLSLGLDAASRDGFCRSFIGRDTTFGLVCEDSDPSWPRPYPHVDRIDKRLADG